MPHTTQSLEERIREKAKAALRRQIEAAIEDFRANVGYPRGLSGLFNDKGQELSFDSAWWILKTSIERDRSPQVESDAIDALLSTVEQQKILAEIGDEEPGE
jgi:hypothetical protein